MARLAGWMKNSSPVAKCDLRIFLNQKTVFSLSKNVDRHRYLINVSRKAPLFPLALGKMQPTPYLFQAMTGIFLFEFSKENYPELLCGC